MQNEGMKDELAYRDWRDLATDESVWLAHKEAFTHNWMKQQG